MLLFFFVCSLVISAFNSVSASESDLVADSWNTKAPMNQARASLGAVVVDGKIYAIGGYKAWNRSTDNAVGTNEVYDPATNSWTILAPMPTPRWGFAIVAWQGKIYCMGGSSFDEQGQSVSLRVNEIYDIATNSWTTKEMPLELSLVGQVVNEQIFVMPLIGDALYRYDPVSDEWTTKTPMSLWDGSVNRLVAVDGKLIVIFNCAVKAPEMSNSLDPMVKAVMIYDPQTDTWSERRGTDTFYGSDFFAVGATTGLYAPQKIYLINATETIVYDLKSDTWSTAKTMPPERYSFAMVVLDDVLYIIGGYEVSESQPNLMIILSSTEQYVPPGHLGVIPATPSPSATIPAEPEPFLYGITIAAIGLTIGAIVLIVLFCCFNKRKPKN
jgi:N-acetylneuraminic acid mutarotase